MEFHFDHNVVEFTFAKFLRQLLTEFVGAFVGVIFASAGQQSFDQLFLRSFLGFGLDFGYLFLSHQSDRALHKVASKYPEGQEDMVLTDIHLQANADSGELLAFNDDDDELTRCVVEQWIGNGDDNFYKEITPEKYVEGPMMFRRNGKCYFMWSEGGWTGPDYCVAYAIADTPFGPFKRIGKILEQDPEVGTGAGHHSILNPPGTDDYYIVYHRHPLNDDNGHHRYTCIDRMTFDAEGKINPVRITLEGVEPQTISR